VPSAQAAWIKLEAKTLREMAREPRASRSPRRDALRAQRVLFALAARTPARGHHGHRLAMASRMVGIVGAAVTGIVPRKAVVEIQRVLARVKRFRSR